MYIDPQIIITLGRGDPRWMANWMVSLSLLVQGPTARMWAVKFLFWGAEEIVKGW